MEDLKLLLDSADLADEAYDPTINKEVGKTIIEGNFPVLINKQGNTLFIAFRGTRASLYKPLESIKNMIANCSSSDFLGENTALSEFPTFNKYLSVDALKLTGHAGYMQQLNEYYTLIIDEIELYRGLITDIVVCGHSAGGGLGTLFYYIYNNDISIDKKIPIKNTISFGAPRVIRDNDANIELYTKSCPDLLRVFNANDLVPYLPLNKSEYGGSLISGFTHVGTPVPLDTNIKVNNLNTLILQVIRGNKSVYNQIIKNYSLDELRENEIMGLITSDKYLGIMTQSLFTCYEKVGVKEGVTDDLILSYTQVLLEDTQALLDYSLKCDLAEPLGISEILKVNNIYNSDTAENIGITGMISSLLGFSKINVKSHEMKTYIENIELLERFEIDTGFSAKRDPESTEYYIPPVPVEPTTRKIFIDLVAEVLKDVDSGKIQGMIEIDESELPALIQY